ncbi:MAG: hypothetical protein KZQ89_03245 [Candidatus Thiodiazotropha sp. (ex Lucinoma kastoroae)]|nr:hypothetical protein [Candidatus Thiodiazotropha sp. (ex Rostrolucina anterorostrata)]MCU7847014.1 hypothetical protein [Candidatus Thiodiazotropha sp. (ex Lucinoma kastoroae)]MCU7859563.1 hypothetical protein [Candidatus Thiodiazotropha sp. (ex Lucinoma kastoroae)]
MLKRLMAVIRQPFSNDQTSQAPQDEAICSTRRGFFKRAAVGAVSITGTAGLAKVVVDSSLQPDLQDNYIKDHLSGEQELSEREYVLMSEQEKADMVQTFINSYSDQS